MTMRACFALLTVFALIILPGCVANGGGSQTSEQEAATQLKHSPEDVPAAVRAIEAQIEKKALILGDHIVIEVSRNYEWDISLTGDDVAKAQRTASGGMRTVAKGSPRATFRNLELRGYQSITLECSGMNVVPYIRIRSLGHAAHALFTSPDGPPVVQRAQEILVQNEKLHAVGPAGQPAAATN